MKKTSLILIATCLISVSLYGQIKYSDDVWTLEEVKSMVSKYNLQDSVTATKNNGLMYKKREDIEDWCQHWVKAINESAIRTAFFKNTEKVRTRADFYNLIDSFPSLRQHYVKTHGGEANFQEYKENSMKTEWRIYRNEKGGLSFQPNSYPISKEEECLGQRIDNLPRKQ